ncbi:ATP-dependent helicase [Taibaiella koreensis]|uniref:ATP-dependent helicase n=1 Tax=Taibaiella koreensis TaxID=1268548 RepID=UPI000E59DF75|nr:ATP-dependent helicase [Taibaiella koreensis]
MYETLSLKQRRILHYNKGRVVVKACPGSGKTFSVAARISNLLRENDFQNNGVAAMSFTNVACDEIKDKLENKFSLALPLQYPHFLGTIDKFINTFIFLPHGHLIMGCNKRPELVGKPHRNWTIGKGDKTYKFFNGKLNCTDANPEGYFDCVSFDINDELCLLVPAQELHFSLKKDRYYKKDGNPRKEIQELINAKWKNFKLGYANQSDANYIALKVLEQYPLIAKALSKKFEYFIIDEAQDTDAIQMRIIEILSEAGANNIMLIGDRDQSIFEWNNADPALFDAKYNEWEKIELDENWRSSQKICNFTRALSTFERSFAVARDVKNYAFAPLICGYDKDNIGSMVPIFQEFFANCEQNGISVNKTSVAILYRGKAMAKYIDASVSRNNNYANPWLPHQYHVKDLIHGKLLQEIGDFKSGYHLLEKAFHELEQKANNPSFHCSQEFIKQCVQTENFIDYRQRVFDFIKILPPASGQRLNVWIEIANKSLSYNGYQIVLNTERRNSNIPISEIIKDDNQIRDHLPFYQGTIHSVKGKTYDAVMLMLDKRAGTHSNYITMLKKGPKVEEAEELRNVYVGLTRPRKILFLAVPKEDMGVWSEHLS